MAAPATGDVLDDRRPYSSRANRLASPRAHGSWRRRDDHRRMDGRPRRRSVCSATGARAPRRRRPDAGRRYAGLAREEAKARDRSRQRAAPHGLRPNAMTHRATHGTPTPRSRLQLVASLEDPPDEGHADGEEPGGHPAADDDIDVGGVVERPAHAAD